MAFHARCRRRLFQKDEKIEKKAESKNHKIKSINLNENEYVRILRHTIKAINVRDTRIKAVKVWERLKRDKIKIYLK